MEPTIYLNFNGNCLEAMTRYADVLGGEITGVYQNKHAQDPQSRMPGGDDLVMNMNMKLGTANVMASDAPDEWYSKPQGFSVSISPASQAAFRLSSVILAGMISSGSGRPGTRAAPGKGS